MDSEIRPVPPATTSETSDASLGDLIRSLTTDASVLIRQEIALAKTELSDSVRSAGRSGTRLVLWTAVGVVGLLVIIAGIVILIGDLFGGAYWISALVVGTALLLIGGGMSYSALRKLREETLAPEETIDSLRRTGDWAQAEFAELRATLATDSAAAANGGGRPSAETSSGLAPIRVVRRPPPRTHADSGHADRDDRSRSKGVREDGDKEELDENIVKRVFVEMQEDDAFNVAGGMAYFAFLALPPTILVIFALTGFFGGEQAAQWITQQLSGVMPETAGEWIDTFVDNVVRSDAPGPFSIGLLLALWAASNVFMAVMRALNLAYGIGRDDQRGFVKARALALGVTVLFVVFLLGGSALLLFGPQIADAFDLFGVAGALWSVAQYVIPLVLVIGAFAIAYYLLPARDQKRHTREILIGALIGGVGWVAATFAFRIYIANFGNYNETYGAIGGIIVLLLWLYLTMLVILTGGQFAAELERRAGARR